MLDWIATTQCTISKLNYTDCIWSDHVAINFLIDIPRPAPPTPNFPQTITTRNLKKLTTQILSESITKIMTLTKENDHPDVLVDAFYETMNNTLETHAPMRTKNARISKKAKKWFSSELKNLLSTKRKAEQTWLNSKSLEDKLEWQTIAIKYKQLINKTKKDYLSARIEESENQSKELFTVLDELENPLKEPPSFTPTKDHCIATQNFFHNKVQTARNKIANNAPTVSEKQSNSPPSSPQKTPTDNTLFHFKPITNDITISILKKMKPCPDKGELFPSKTILKHQSIFAPFLTRLINASFSHNHVPERLKSVRVSPIPKKADADQTDPSNLRPITLVLFLLKLLDKAATAQFHEHIKCANILHNQQSGFRSGFSTETALLDLQIKMRNLLENNKAGLLVLLDLSAAYDLLDHQILLKRLQSNAQCSQSACAWIESFLTNRQSKVTWGNAESPPEALIYGVPQGACLSPALFNTYVQPLFATLEELGVVFTNYADDTQILLELTGEYEKDSKRLSEVYAIIKGWMNENWMCLNGTKTELLIVASKDKRTKLGKIYDNFPIEQATITTAQKVKTLGVILDTSLTMTAHINYIYKSSHYHLKRLRAIRPLLSKQHSATIARAIILPRLDYCNALLTNTTQANIHKLQVIQNEAARVVGKIARREHISTFRKELHWLPVASRIMFKTLCLTHKSLHNTAPPYLSAVIQPYTQPRSLRSNNTGLIHCPRALKKCGNRSSFIVTGPTNWNNLPQDIRMEQSLPKFKSLLKTFLFN